MFVMNQTRGSRKSRPSGVRLNGPLARRKLERSMNVNQMSAARAVPQRESLQYSGRIQQQRLRHGRKQEEGLIAGAPVY
jgi:hypothetical protein